MSAKVKSHHSWEKTVELQKNEGKGRKNLSAGEGPLFFLS